MFWLCASLLVLAMVGITKLASYCDAHVEEITDFFQ